MSVNIPANPTPTMMTGLAVLPFSKSLDPPLTNYLHTGLKNSLILKFWFLHSIAICKLEYVMKSKPIGCNTMSEPTIASSCDVTV